MVRFPISTTFWDAALIRRRCLIEINAYSNLSVIYLLIYLFIYLLIHLFQFFDQHQPNRKNNYKLTTYFYKLSWLQVCHKPITIFQYDPESKMQFKFSNSRSSHRGYSIKKAVLKSFLNIHRKIYFPEFQAEAQVFSCEFWEISKKNVFTKYLQTIAF